MTLINEKEMQLEIIIQTPSPIEERDNILKSLCAAIRWNGIISQHSHIVNDRSLVTLSILMQSLISDVIMDKKVEQLRITLHTSSPREEIIDIMKALCRATKWYGNVATGANNSQEYEHFLTIVELLEKLCTEKAINN